MAYYLCLSAEDIQKQNLLDVNVKGDNGARDQDPLFISLAGQLICCVIDGLVWEYAGSTLLRQRKRPSDGKVKRFFLGGSFLCG